MAFTISASINQAINFITRPLSLVHAPATINALQTILRSTFYAAFVASGHTELVLAFTSATPPLPVLAACIAVGIQWSEWIQLFNQRNFVLIITTDKILARYPAPATESDSGLASSQDVVLWAASQLTPSKRSLLATLSNDVARVPISKMRQNPAIVGTKPRMVAPAPPTRIVLPSASLYPQQPRTLAQQLIDSDDEEADELFAMISKTSIISPTPTRERFALSSFSTTSTVNKPKVAPFHHHISPISSPEPLSSPESSRPSSRTSTFSSCFSEKSESSSSPSTVSLESCDIPEVDCDTDASSRVYVDTSKTDKTKYLYQGGVSSTLTGGVMLGCPAPQVNKSRPSAPAPKPTFTKTTSPYTARPVFTRPSPAQQAPPAQTQQQQQKYRAPVGGRRTVAVNGSGASAPSWRRTAAPVSRW